MATEKKRILVTVHDEWPYRVLGIEPSSYPIATALSQYARAIEDATASVSQVLGRQEWNYLADVLNGCGDIYAESGLSARLVLTAEAEDAHRLNRTGDKWFAPDDPAVVVEGESPDERVAALLLTLRGLSEIEAQAVLLAVRHFWERSEEIDHTVDEWWGIAHRMRPRE